MNKQSYSKWANRPVRFSVSQLEKWFNKFGWSVVFEDNSDFPYNTKSCVIVPSEPSHILSDEMLELCYAFGYFDAKIDFVNKCIILW